MSEPAASNVVTLALGRNANAFSCGSCFFFRYRNDVPDYVDHDIVPDVGGYCTFKFPPQVQMRQLDEGIPTNWVNDSDSCDLWRSTGKTYIVSRKVRP